MKKTLLASVLLSSLISADTTELETHTELGYIKNDGNTKNETFTLDMKLKKEWEKHISTTVIQGKYNEEDKVETGNNWLAETQYDYKFSKIFTFNYLLGYKEDKFSSFDFNGYTGPGMKYIAINKPKEHNLNFTLNYMYAIDKDKAAPKDKHEYQSARLAMEYFLKISDNLKFSEDATYRTNLESSKTYFAYSKTTLSSKISDKLSAGISYKLDYVNDVPSDIKRVDSTMTASLIIDY